MTYILFFLFILVCPFSNGSLVSENPRCTSMLINKSSNLVYMEANFFYMWAKHFYMWAKLFYMWAKRFYMWAKLFYMWAKLFYMWAKRFYMWAKLFLLVRFSLLMTILFVFVVAVMGQRRNIILATETQKYQLSDIRHFILFKLPRF